MYNLDKIQLKNSISLLIGGWVYSGGDIQEAPEILQEVKEDYIKAFEKEKLNNE